MCGGAKRMMLHYLPTAVLAAGGNLVPRRPRLHGQRLPLVRFNDPLDLFPIRQISLS
jgi:hypothetical protein